MPRRKFLIIFVGICLLLVIITLSYFLWHDSLIEANSEITNFFFIHNWGNTSHEVTVELFNTQNASVFNESYISVPGETIESQFPITPVPGVEIEVTKQRFQIEIVIQLINDALFTAGAGKSLPITITALKSGIIHPEKLADTPTLVALSLNTLSGFSISSRPFKGSSNMKDDPFP